MTTDCEPDEPEVFDDWLKVGPVRVGLRLAIMHRPVRRPRQLDLRPGLERHRGVPAAKSDDRAAVGLMLRLPAVLSNQLVEDRHDTDRTVIRQVRAVDLAHRDPLRFGTDPPTLPRLLRVVEQHEQVIHPAKRGIGFWQRVL